MRTRGQQSFKENEDAIQSRNSPRKYDDEDFSHLALVSGIKYI